MKVGDKVRVIVDGSKYTGDVGLVNAVFESGGCTVSFVDTLILHFFNGDEIELAGSLSRLLSVEPPAIGDVEVAVVKESVMHGGQWVTSVTLEVHSAAPLTMDECVEVFEEQSPW